MECLPAGLQVVHPAVAPAPTFGMRERRYVEKPACYDIVYVSENLTERVADIVVDAGIAASDHQPVVLEMC